MTKGNRFIVENRSSVADTLAMLLVIRVMEEGRVSNNGRQYCYASVFTVTEEDETPNRVAVYTDLNKGSDRFVVCDVPAERRAVVS